jgi:hypothetical protein
MDIFVRVCLRYIPYSSWLTIIFYDLVLHFFLLICILIEINSEFLGDDFKS